MTIALPAQADVRRRALALDMSLPVLLVAAALLCVLIILPMSWLVYYSLVDRAGAFTLGNFRSLITEPEFLAPMLTTLVLATTASLACCAVAAPMGWLVARTDMPFGGVVRALVTASFVTPPFLGAIAWELLAAPNSGMLNKLYRHLAGAEMDEHLFNIYSMGGLIFVVSCYTFPYVFVLIANALDRIPGDLEDASAILGGRIWTTARRVTIPLALPALLAGLLIAFLQAMTLFGSPAILALPAGFHTMTTKIWSLFQFPPKPELAAAASLPLLVLTVMLLRAQHMVLGRKGYSVVGGKTGDPRLIRLGWLRWPALGLVLADPHAAGLPALFRAAQRRDLAARHDAGLTPATATLHNIVLHLRPVIDQDRTAEHLLSRSHDGDDRHPAGAGDRLHHRPQGGRGPRGARVSCDRADSDPGHRARRRPVPELHAGRRSCFTAPCGSCCSPSDDRVAGRLPAPPVRLQGGAPRPRGRQPNPRRHPPAHAAPYHRAAAAHQRHRDLVLHLRGDDP